MIRVSPAVEVVAHRGASAYRPEHTLAAYELALRQGADVLELDVRVTADRRLVVLHDATLLRTARVARRVGALSLAEVRAACGAARPLTLDAVLGHFGDATRYLVELKDPAPAWERDVLAAIDRHGLGARVTLQSFDALALRRLATEARSVAPLLRRRPRTGTLDAIARFATGVGVWHGHADARLVEAAHARGLAVRAWTVNAVPVIERVLAAGVDGVITDAPDVASAVSGRRAALPRAA